MMMMMMISNVNMQIQSNNIEHTSCYIGSYQVDTEPFNECSGWRDCEKGYYCISGNRYECPSGTFGETEKLSSSRCSGPCPKGYFCPKGSVTGTPCGKVNSYCPEASVAPIPVPVGYYSKSSDGTVNVDDMSSLLRSDISICEEGFYCVDGIRYMCKSGVYGNEKGLSSLSCSGPCPKGFFCEAGTVDPYSRPCGPKPSSYCPEASSHPLPTSLGYYAVSSETTEGAYSSQVVCPRGFYCIDGTKYPCPAGRYGGQVMETNSSCTGVCRAGSYCPPASTRVRQHGCGNASVYCPEGSEAPTRVSTGHYTVGNEYVNDTWYWQEIQTYADFTAGENFHELHRVSQQACEPGYYCEEDGIKRGCPPGRYGSRYGMTSQGCDGVCDEGYYCPEASTSPQQLPCNGTDRFCPFGSHAPKMVHSGYYTLDRQGEFLQDIDGHTTVQYHTTTRVWEKRCEPGHYCYNGTKHMCKRGYWGGEFGLTSELCSGKCSSGFYCPLGSISSTEVMCGDPNRYCVEGSWRPLEVDLGYYSVGGGNETTRTGQAIAPVGYYAEKGILRKCKSGFYGAAEGLSRPSCSGPCSVPGYYCPEGSVSPTMKACGSDNVYCPPKSVAPINVSPGFYTSDYTSFTLTLTDPGSSDYSYFSKYAACRPGTYRNWTLSKDSSSLKSPSPSDVVTAKQVPPCELCPKGKYKSVVGDEVSLCKSCDAKTARSTSDRVTCKCVLVVAPGQLPHFEFATGACKAYSSADFSLLDEGYFGTNTSVTRFREFECEPGYYCADGVRYTCPRGRYGTEYRETRPSCAGPCAQGYFCPEASSSAYSQPCGAANRICAAGADVPTVVPKGRYSHEDIPENIRYEAYACEPGRYCPGDGKRYRCPVGRYGDTYNTSDPLCTGPCYPGYYCEEGSSSPRQFECGGTSYYCVTGSSKPAKVTSGFYGIHTGDDGGAKDVWDPLNRTYSAEIPCEPGYFCDNGLKQPCPPGRFGWRYGMNTSECGGLCAAGYYCPSYLDPAQIPEAPAHTQWPRKPHLQAAEYECGKGSSKSTLYYCPRGSFFPQVVGGGNYTTGGDATNTTRFDQAVCPPGTFCSDGLSLACPKGKYGSTPGLATQACSGWCTPGHYCTLGTANPIPCPPNHYAGGATSYCSQCPGSRLTPLQCNDARSCCFAG